MRTISKCAIIPWHCAHTLSSADILLHPILLPEKQNKNQLLLFTLVSTKCQTIKKKKKTFNINLEAAGFEPLFFRIADQHASH
jgi:hypothetical protein